MGTPRTRILLVDDSKDLAADFRLWFEAYDFVHAPTAEKALALLKKPNAFKLVLLDVRLPGMDGLTALEKIKALAPGKPVIIMTAYGSTDTVVRALKAKADDYIEKPFDLPELRAMLEKELHSGGAPCDLDLAGKVDYARSFIERNCFGKVTLKQAADALCMTPKYLSRVFRARTGTGFNAYKLKVKMEQAKVLLRSSDRTVKQVSEKLGYENVEALRRQFKKHIRTTPSGYRKKSKR